MGGLPPQGENQGYGARTQRLSPSPTDRDGEICGHNLLEKP